jgi:hypothetical protein
MPCVRERESKGAIVRYADKSGQHLRDWRGSRKESGIAQRRRRCLPSSRRLQRTDQVIRDEAQIGCCGWVRRTAHLQKSGRRRSRDLPSDSTATHCRHHKETASQPGSSPVRRLPWSKPARASLRPGGPTRSPKWPSADALLFCPLRCSPGDARSQRKFSWAFRRAQAYGG